MALALDGVALARAQPQVWPDRDSRVARELAIGSPALRTDHVVSVALELRDIAGEPRITPDPACVPAALSDELRRDEEAGCRGGRRGRGGLGRRCSSRPGCRRGRRGGGGSVGAGDPGPALGAASWRGRASSGPPTFGLSVSAVTSRPGRAVGRWMAAPRSDDAVGATDPPEGLAGPTSASGVLTSPATPPAGPDGSRGMTTNADVAIPIRTATAAKATILDRPLAIERARGAASPAGRRRVSGQLATTGGSTSSRSLRRRRGTPRLSGPSSADRRGPRMLCRSTDRPAAARPPGAPTFRRVHRSGRSPRPPMQRPKARSSGRLSQAVDPDGGFERDDPAELESARHRPPDAMRRSHPARPHPTTGARRRARHGRASQVTNSNCAGVTYSNRVDLEQVLDFINAF